MIIWIAIFLIVVVLLQSVAQRFRRRTIDRKQFEKQQYRDRIRAEARRTLSEE